MKNLQHTQSIATIVSMVAEKMYHPPKIITFNYTKPDRCVRQQLQNLFKTQNFPSLRTPPNLLLVKNNRLLHPLSSFLLEVAYLATSATLFCCRLKLQIALITRFITRCADIVQLEVFSSRVGFRTKANVYILNFNKILVFHYQQLTFIGPRKNVFIPLKKKILVQNTDEVNKCLGLRLNVLIEPQTALTDSLYFA